MKESELVLGVLVGVGVYLLSRKPEPSIEAEPGGGVQLGARLGVVKAGMGQSLYKTAYDNVKVSFTWQADTRDKNTKLLIPWIYKVEVRLGHNVALPYPQWKDASQLGFPVTGAYSTVTPLVSGPQPALYFFSAPDDHNQVWDIRVRLSAANPTNPTSMVPSQSSFEQMATGELVGAFTTLSPGLQLGGSLGSIAVAQQRGRVGRMGI